MTTDEKTRSWWSTAIVTLLAGYFGGLLWIGAGRWAVTILISASLAVVYFLYFGIPLLPGGYFSSEVSFTLLQIGFSLICVVLVVPFAKRFTADKWYSSGLAVTALALGSMLVVGIVRSLLFQPFSIPSGAMYPTLQEGDYMIAGKSAYGYGRYTLPFDIVPFEGRIFAGAPQRGDIAVFRSPQSPELDFVMRIVGLPGEKIRMVDGVLNIDGRPVRLDEAGRRESDDFDGWLQRETLPNGVSYWVFNLNRNGVGDVTQEFVVPAGHYFMLGDNRDNSSDSRFRMGPVPWENLVGRAERIFWNSHGVEYADRMDLRPSQ